MNPVVIAMIVDKGMWKSEIGKKGNELLKRRVRLDRENRLGIKSEEGMRIVMRVIMEVMRMILISSMRIIRGEWGENNMILEILVRFGWEWW